MRSCTSGTGCGTPFSSTRIFPSRARCTASWWISSRGTWDIRPPPLALHRQAERSRRAARRAVARACSASTAAAAVQLSATRSAARGGCRTHAAGDVLIRVLYQSQVTARLCRVDVIDIGAYPVVAVGDSGELALQLALTRVARCRREVEIIGVLRELMRVGREARGLTVRARREHAGIVVERLGGLGELERGRMRGGGAGVGATRECQQ